MVILWMSATRCAGHPTHHPLAVGVAVGLDPLTRRETILRVCISCDGRNAAESVFAIAEANLKAN